MKQQNIALKTLGIKARVYNQIRTQLFKKRLEDITPEEKLAYFNGIFQLNLEAHRELNDYKQKRKDKAELLKTRLAAPQTKSMMKKLGIKKDLENPI